MVSRLVLIRAVSFVCLVVSLAACGSSPHKAGSDELDAAPGGGGGGDSDASAEPLDGDVSDGGTSDLDASAEPLDSDVSDSGTSDPGVIDGGDAADAPSAADTAPPGDDSGTECGPSGCQGCTAPEECTTGVCSQGVCADAFELAGRVFEGPGGAPLANATVTSPDGSYSTTDDEGVFALLVPAATTLVEVRAAGFTPTFAPVQGSLGSTYAEVLLKRPTLSRSVHADQPFVIDGSGVRISGPALAFVDANGTAPSGPVDIVVTLTDPNDPLDRRSAPTGFLMLTPEGDELPAPRMTVVDISAYAGAAELNLAPDTELVVDFPIELENPRLEAHVYSLDEQDGLWRPEGVAVRTLDSADRPVYRAQLTHLSWWSTWWWDREDYETERVCAKVRIIRDGKPISAYFHNETRGWEGIAYYDPWSPKVMVYMSPKYTTTFWADWYGQSPKVERKLPKSGCVDIGDLKLPKLPDPPGCPSGTKSCSGACKSLKTDINNCGACGTVCASGQSCMAGSCTCAEGTKACSGACKDTRNDRTNCGGCGVTCKSYQECTAGSCVDTPCPQGMTRCGTECIDVKGDNRLHCGACNKPCGQGDYCASGSCVIVPVCGDGITETGDWTEACDDSVNDGSYGSCTEDCLGFGPRCGDGIVQADEGETCEPGTVACPSTCDDAKPCTADSTTGTSATCDVACSHRDVTAAIQQDGCCPNGLYADTDDDCVPACGNSVTEPGEACDDGVNDGSYEGCAVGCATLAAYCGDGTVQPEHGETCDKASASKPCPTSCDDGDPCTSDAQTGSAAACTASCDHAVITAEVPGDGCCPDGSDSTGDSDCPVVCGNNIREGLEVCDDGFNDGRYGGCAPGCSTLGPYCGDGTTQFGRETCDGDSCLAIVCNDSVACTKDLVTGSPSTCDTGCLFEPIVAPKNGDQCCPDGAHANNDNDCTPVCGNGQTESGEVCDDEDREGGDGCSADCKSDETCGNGKIDSAVGEICDDSNANGGDGCSADCKSGEVCGNGIIDAAAGEVCDDSDAVGGDGCSANCKSDETCGNKITDALAGEVCDDGNTTGGDGCNTTCLAKVEVSSVGLGWPSACAVLSNGRGYCWGTNQNNTLGVGSLGDPARTPRQILTNRADWTSITGSGAGEDAHRCALTQGQGLFCWGDNDLFGKVGNGNATSYVTSPYQHASTWSSVAVTRAFTAAVKTDGTLCRWGTNFGLTPTCSTTGWASAFGYYDHVCLLKSDGSLWCFGTNVEGQLGQNNFIGSDTPARVQTATNWLTVAAGAGHTCGIRGTSGSGSLWCWGDNEYGQLGYAGTNTNNGTIDTVDNAKLPAQLGSDTNWTQVAAGLDHTCALKSDQSLWCWGRNNLGQLGKGDVVTRTTPTQVEASSQWTKVFVGTSFTCAIRSDGTLWCFGSNTWGQLGLAYDASISTYSATPRRVSFP